MNVYINYYSCRELAQRLNGKQDKINLKIKNHKCWNANSKKYQAQKLGKRPNFRENGWKDIQWLKIAIRVMVKKCWKKKWKTYFRNWNTSN